MTTATALPTERELRFIQSQRIARMATVDKSGRPLVVPICYAYHGNNLYTPVDTKPKTVSPRALKRIRNISSNPNVSVVVDVYNEDWDKIGFVVVHGAAEVIESGAEYRRSLRILSGKYRQYRDMKISQLGLPVIKIVPTRIVSWGSI